MNKDEIRYLLFPIELLQETDIKKVCRKAIDYGIYRKALDFIVEGETKVMPRHIEQSMAYFNLVVNGLEQRVKDGKVLYDTFTNSNPMVSISKETLIQYNNEDKTDFEVLTFRAYCAIRSILGTKPFVKATNEYLMARMYGFRNVLEFQNSSCAELPRYQLDKIKLELQKDWYLIYYSRQTRGFYVSFTIELEKLIYHAEINRESYKAKTLKQAKDEAYQKVMQRLKKPP
jgi:hypothetical protein